MRSAFVLPVVTASVAHIDWLTLTYIVHEPSELEMQSRMREILLSDLATPQDEPYVSCRRIGFDGWRRGSFFIGARHKLWCEMVSGPAAQSHLLPAGRDARASRLDVALDLWLASDVDAVISELAAWADAVSKYRPKNRRYAVEHRKTYGNGDTLYLGRRGKTNFVRIYDKYAESGDEFFAGCLRIEVELKDEDAFEVLGSWKREGRERALASVVRGVLEGKGLAFIPALAPAPYNRVRKHYENRNDEVTMEWLRSQVRPAIMKLAGRGRTKDEILKALALAGIYWKDGETDGENTRWGADNSE